MCNLSKAFAAATIAVGVLALSCNGNSSPTPSGVVAGPILPFSAGLPGLPQDNYVDPQTIIARRGSIVGEIALLGNQYYKKDSDAVASDSDQNIFLTSADPDRCWAMYRFADLVAADNPNLFTSLLDDTQLPAECFVAWSDYSNLSWQWTEVYSPTGLGDPIALPEVDGSPIQPISPGGNVYAIVSVINGEAATIDMLSLTLDSQSPPPTNVQATDGTWADRIRVIWSEPSYAHDRILLERLEGPRGSAEAVFNLPADTSMYDDIHEGSGGGQNNVPYNNPTYYRVRVRIGTTDGPASLADVGRRIAPDVTGLAATDGTYAEKVVISWDICNGSDGYKLEYRNIDGGAPAAWTALAEIADGATLDFEHTYNAPVGKECANQTNYEYRAKSTWQTEESQNWSPTNVGYRDLAPPTGLQASDEWYPDKISLAWVKTNGATGYKIYRDSQVPGAEIATVGDVDQYDDAAVPDFNQHTYWVTGTFVGGESDFSTPDTGEKIEWQVHSADDGPGVVGIYSFLSELNGNPAICHYDSTNTNLKFARATTSTPTAPEHWQKHDVTANGEEPAMTVLDGKPVISFSHYAVDNTQLWFARATTATPTSSGHWNIHIVDSTAMCGFYSSVAIVGDPTGYPMVSYLVGYPLPELWFARALTETPSSTGDWNKHRVDDAAGLNLLNTTSIADIEGKPAICYIDRVNSDLRFAQATTETPSAAGDWAIHIVDDGIEDCSMTVLNGMPAVAYRSGSNTTFARATTATPSGPEDWVIVTVDGSSANGDQTIAVHDGLPVIAYQKGDDIYVAQALTPLPTITADFVVHVVVPGSTIQNHYPTIAVVSGKLGITFQDTGNSLAKYASVQ